MPRFFFNTTCPDRELTDLVGERCRTLEEARGHARKLASELANSQLFAGQAPTGWIEVEDEQHRSLFMVPFSSIAS